MGREKCRRRSFDSAILVLIVPFLCRPHDGFAQVDIDTLIMNTALHKAESNSKRP
jgi:hypothetical protein